MSAIRTSLRTFHSKKSPQAGFLHHQNSVIDPFWGAKAASYRLYFPITFEPYNIVKCLGHFDGKLFPILHLVCNQTKQHGIHGGKYFLKSPGNVISETLIFKISLDAPALKKLVTFVRVPKPPTIHYHPAT